MKKITLLSITLIVVLFLNIIVAADEVKTSVTVVDPGNAQVLGAQTNTESKCAADFDGINGVDDSDLETLYSNYQSYTIICSLDIVGDDCYIDQQDLSLFAGQYNSVECL